MAETKDEEELQTLDPHPQKRRPDIDCIEPCEDEERTVKKQKKPEVDPKEEYTSEDQKQKAKALDKGKGKMVIEDAEEKDSDSDSDSDDSDGLIGDDDGEDSDFCDDPLAEVDLDNILPSRTRRPIPAVVGPTPPPPPVSSLPSASLSSLNLFPNIKGAAAVDTWRPLERWALLWLPELTVDVKLAGVVPVPVAAMMEGSAWRRSHSMVWPSDLWPSSRVSWKTRAAQMMGMRMRRPRPSTLEWRSFEGGFLTAIAVPLGPPADGDGTVTSCWLLGLLMLLPLGFRWGAVPLELTPSVIVK